MPRHGRATAGRRWRRWEKARLEEMANNDVPRELAREVAKIEAKTRRRISGIVGEAIAQGASLIAITDSKGRTRFFITGSVDELTPEARTRIQQAAARRKSWIPMK